MGSDKKRKRRESEAADGEPADAAALSEKKAAKKAKKVAAAAAAAAASPAPKSAKKEKAPSAAGSDDEGAGANAISELPPLVSPIASPMADKKLTKKAYKLVSHAAKAKALRRGIKEVVLALRKGEKGVCIIAGDVFPVEVCAHLPLLCEEAGVPYAYVSRKTDLGLAALTKRPTSVVLVSEKSADKELVEELSACRKEVAAVQTAF
jgi:H/ACA ribonucleoprotein complex subunit 2